MNDWEEPNMNIPGYINPRSLDNHEPNNLLHMDLFFEEELWERYIEVAGPDLRNRRVYDVAWQIAIFCGPKFAQGYTTAIFKCGFGGQFGGPPAEIAEVSLRAYQHPRYLALCVGLASTD